jgi:hypothetical protein
LRTDSLFKSQCSTLFEKKGERKIQKGFGAKLYMKKNFPYCPKPKTLERGIAPMLTVDTEVNGNSKSTNEL